MQLRFIDDQGQNVIVQLGSNSISVGRSEDADVQIIGGNISRLHFAIRQWDEDYILKDLRSENGTLVNGERVDVVRLHAGDKITIGRHNIFFERKSRKTPSPETVIKKIGQEMTHDRKGYSTMLVEIVKEAEDK